MVMPIVAIAVGALWYFSIGPQPRKAPETPPQPRLSAAMESRSAIATPDPIKPQPGTEPKTQAEPPSPDEAMAPAALPDEEPTKAFAEVLGYGWVLNSKCAPYRKSNGGNTKATKASPVM